MLKQSLNLQIYLIADAGLCGNTAKLLKLTAEAINAGVTCVQLRMKAAPPETIAKVGVQLLKLLKPKKIPLIINDHLGVAKQINADGVHIGQNDISYTQAREILGNNKIIGLSIENYQQALSCHSLAVDYFAVGPIFTTKTKTDAAPAIGLIELAKIKQLLIKKPVIAIGGINAINASQVLATQVNGIALASAILSAANPSHVTQTIGKLYEKI